MLFAVSGIVVSILYVSASKQRFAYGLLTLLLIAGLPSVVAPFVDSGEEIPNKLQPTLAVWAILSMLVELSPRRPDDPEHLPDQADLPTRLSGKSDPNTR